METLDVLDVRCPIEGMHGWLDQREKFTKCVSHESTDVKTRTTKLSFLSLEIILEIQNGAQRRGERREERGRRE